MSQADVSPRALVAEPFVRSCALPIGTVAYVDPVTGLRDYRAVVEPQPRRRSRRWLVVGIAFALGFVCGAASVYAAEPPCVQLKVRPQILLHRGDIDVQIRIARHDDHRLLRVEWDSETGWAGSSETHLNGAAAPVLHQFWLDDYPPATYEFLSTITNADGRVVGRDRARILSPEPPE